MSGLSQPDGLVLNPVSLHQVDVLQGSVQMVFPFVIDMVVIYVEVILRVILEDGFGEFARSYGEATDQDGKFRICGFEAEIHSLEQS